MKVVDIVTGSLSLLDAEGSERYLWEKDFRPAINIASNWAVALFNRFIAETKRPEEALMSISKRAVVSYPASPEFQVSLAALSTSGIWSVLGVELLYGDRIIPYKRITVEQPGRLSMNCFSPGNSFANIWDDTFEGAYVSPMTYYPTPDSLASPASKVIQLFPKRIITPANVGITFVELPARVTDAADGTNPEYPTGGTSNTTEVVIPDQCETLFINKVVQLVSLKELGTSNMFSVTSAELQQLTSLML